MKFLLDFQVNLASEKCSIAEYPEFSPRHCGCCAVTVHHGYLLEDALFRIWVKEIVGLEKKSLQLGIKICSNPEPLGYIPTLALLNLRRDVTLQDETLCAVSMRGRS